MTYTYRSVYIIPMTNEETKRKLTNLAITLFASRGYNAVGVQEICNTAEISKPTLYYYFKSKAGILEEIANTKGLEFRDKLRTAAEYKHDFSQSLRDILICVIDFAIKNQDFFRLHCVLNNAPEGIEEKLIYQQVIEGIDEIILDFFKSSTSEFGNMKGKEQLYSQLYLNNCISIANMVLLGSLKDDESTIYQIVHSFIYGVAS